MNTQAKQPETLMECIRYFANPEVCREFVVNMRWPDGIECIYCQSMRIGYIKSRNKYQCKDCRKQFSVKIGTIFEDSPLSLDKWLTAMWMIANCKNGISSYELGRSIGITQKSAWHMMHRIRLAMQNGSLLKLGGEGKTVEVDETFIGGKARFMHKDRRNKKIQGGTGGMGKVAVMGILERQGEVRTTVIPNVRRRNLDPRVRDHVKSGSEVHTDALPSYESLRDDYVHQAIDHAERYVDGHVHTNGMENYWSLLKRAIKGTYISVEPFHLFRYLDEQAYRFNNRKATDSERFRGILEMITGKRLTYDKLIGEAPVV